MLCFQYFFRKISKISKYSLNHFDGYKNLSYVLHNNLWNIILITQIKISLYKLISYNHNIFILLKLAGLALRASLANWSPKLYYIKFDFFYLKNCCKYIHPRYRSLNFIYFILTKSFMTCLFFMYIFFIDIWA